MTRDANVNAVRWDVSPWATPFRELTLCLLPKMRRAEGMGGTARRSDAGRPLLCHRGRDRWGSRYATIH